MKISQFVVNPFCENMFILWTRDGGEAIVIDPGMLNAGEREALDKFLTKHSLALQRVILTHQHLDHIFSAKYLAERYSVPVGASPEDNPLGLSLPEQSLRFGVRQATEPMAITEELHGGDTLTLGGEEIKVIEVPGHSPGGLSFYLPSMKCVFVGDTLFQRSIGRTDLLGGDFDQLIASIRSALFALPDETVVYPGHGEATTIGEERHLNPYLAQYCR